MRVVANFVHPDGVGGRWEDQRLITSEKELYDALEELCSYNLEYLFKFDLPDIYRAGIVYEAEPPGQEDWLTYPILVQLGAGDCEDLACARVSWLRQRGENARPYLYHKGTLWHVMVQRGDKHKSIEDPSAVLGMYEVLANVAGLSRREQQRLAMVAGLHAKLGLL